jgi:hypothetical protein
MNKKNSALLGIILSVFMGSIFAHDARSIRKDLKEKHALGLLNECQLIEEGVDFLEILERDICIMQDHKKLLQRKIAANKGFFARRVVPFFKITGISVAAGVSACTGLFATIGNAWVDELFQGKGDCRIKIADFGISIGSYFGFLKPTDIAQYVQVKFDEINKKNPGFKEVALLTPLAGAISIVSGVLFIKMAISVCLYNSRLRAVIIKWQSRVARDNLIIARLKELKYNLIH